MKKKLMKKKGFFFTLSAILLIILLVSIISTRTSYRYREKQESIKTRLITMNNFIEDFEDDFDRAIYIAGYRSLISMTSYLKQSQNFLFDLNNVFSEVFLNGTINNSQMDLMRQENNGLETGADIKSWLSRINQEAEKLDIHVLVNINNITIYQEDPWNVTIIVDVNLIFNDKNNLANWNYSKIFAKKIPIFGFEDPLYVVATKDKVTNLINRTPFNEFVDESNITALIQHYEKSYYRESNKAPSFLMRFYGNLSESDQGIESFVYLPEYFAQFGSYKDRSVIDFIYFGNLSITTYCNITGMPEEFRIDNLHITDYEINELNYTEC